MKFIAFLLLFFFYHIYSTSACICDATKTVKDAFKSSDLIVHAKVLKLEFVTYDQTVNDLKLDSLCKEIENYPLRMELYHNEIITKVEIEVLKVFKGKLSTKNIVFFTPKSHTSCGFTAFAVGSDFLIYGTESYHTFGLFGRSNKRIKKENTFWTNSCSRTKPFDIHEYQELNDCCK